ncbi:YicC/YloC family endoribonuclease [Pseudalkalibacillus decolorationis]|uniref:YicC/YloC family endoribonuclease n=1 Tax=Pseudalkalibacillus decolorationis TaxID=163879 RepID=UPI0021494CFA|nr:YicC/YloC family endoribonuclease [Pseudalkalibacillus decolorationis]
MIKSMTGFGRSFLESQHYSITTEVKSVNHRFCEVGVRMPRNLSSLEDKVKRTVTKYIQRGKVDVFITINGVIDAQRELEIDWTLLDQYVQSYIKLRERYQFQDPIDYDKLLLLPDVVSIYENEQVTDEFASHIITSISDATIQLVRMREEEGIYLTKDLSNRLSVMEAIIEEIRLVTPEISQGYETRLYKKIKELSNGFVEADESRILTEVALFAEKSNIDEELTRLLSHTQQFKQILSETTTVGRKLDFLVQEMNRESNTIGSKANGFAISKKVIELKSEIEKVKEQVQNIE